MKKLSEYEMDDGVYIDLDFETYLHIEAISSSQLKAASVSGEKWAYQQLHQFQSSPSMVVGSALDCLITEGHAKYLEQYDDGLVPTDTPYLATVPEIKAECKARKLAVSGSKSELAERLIADGWEGIIKGVNDNTGDVERTRLTSSQASTVDKCSDAMHRAGLVSEYFRGGYGQVSVIWTGENGERFKARFDYLKNGAIYDLKTTSGKPDKSIMECCVGDIVNYRYDIQAVMYGAALSTANLVRENGDYAMPIVWCGSRGNDDDLRHHLKSCGVFEFVFQRTVAPYDNATVMFSRSHTDTGEVNAFFQKASKDMEVAHERIITAKDDMAFGIKKGPVRAELTDDMVPGWFLNS